MSFTLVDKPATIDALADVWASTGDLLAGLDDTAWKAPTPLPGWDVAANVAHVIGTEAMLLGIDSPAAEVDREALPHVRNDIGAFNEAWVIELADTPPAGLLERFTTITAQRMEALQAMDDDGWSAESWTPVGRESYGRFMRIRVSDCWMHEQDIRDGAGRSGHESGPAAEAVLDEIAVSLGFVVGKKAGAPDGATVTYRLTGDAARDLHVAVDGRAALVDSLPGEATVTLTMPVGVFTRLCGGRITADEARAGIDVAGDEELADRLVSNGAYTI